FYDLDNYYKEEASISDFRGKWLILDFWNRGCIACVESFPKMNDIQLKYKEKLQLIMVGYTDNRISEVDAIKRLYYKVKDIKNLKFTTAFDSVLYEKKWKRWGAPYIVVVDPEGIVQYITISLTEQNVRDIL